MCRKVRGDFWPGDGSTGGALHCWDGETSLQVCVGGTYTAGGCCLSPGKVSGIWVQKPGWPPLVQPYLLDGAPQDKNPGLQRCLRSCWALQLISFQEQML